MSAKGSQIEIIHFRIYSEKGNCNDQQHDKSKWIVYSKNHCGNKTILRPSYLHNGISSTGKITSLYWIRALGVIHTVRASSCLAWITACTLQWHHNGRDSISNNQPHHCFLNRLFRRRSKKTSKRRVSGLCEGNSPGTGEFPTQRASNAENVSIWWRHHDMHFSQSYFTDTGYGCPSASEATLKNIGKWTIWILEPMAQPTN